MIRLIDLNPWGCAPVMVIDDPCPWPTDGVPPMSRDQIHAALGECPACYELGHICRPCRAKRYADRQADETGVRAALVVVYYAVGIMAVAVAAFLAVARG